jgi:hypothetical protein
MCSWVFIQPTKTRRRPGIEYNYFCKPKTNKMEGKVADTKTVVDDARVAKILAVKALMRERDDAKKAADFTKSDALREKLSKDYEVVVFDQVGGPSGWKFKDGSNKKLPPGIVEAEMPGAVKRKRDDTSSESAKNVKTKLDKDVAKTKGTKNVVMISKT